MKTKAFDYCLRFLGHWNDPDGKIREEMLCGPDTFIKDFVDPFRRELQKNLLTKKKQAEKRDVIKFYVNELNRTTKILETYFSMDFIVIRDENSKIVGRFSMTPGTDVQFRFFQMIYMLYRLLFDEIQNSCNVFDIPFFEICEELSFPLKMINTRITPANVGKEKQSSSKNSKESTVLIGIRPKFAPENILQLFDILKGFFSDNHQIELLKILQTGGTAEKPLLFRASGNRLADSFKQLYDCGIIMGCQKQDLEKWIQANFTYQYRNTVKQFSLPYLSEIISTTKDKCQKPLLNAFRDQVSGNYQITKA
jgi:hypothetical protein